MGRQRHVFLHPTDPEKLVKVLKPTEQLEKFWTFRSITDRLFPAARYRQIRKEHAESKRVVRLAAQRGIAVPVAEVYEIVETDLGRASIVDRVVSEEGRLGATLMDIRKDKAFGLQELALLNDTLRRIFDLDVRASDMNQRNFIFGHRFKDGQLGPRECVLVDGFGDIHAIPVRTFSNAFNRTSLNEGLRRLSKGTELEIVSDAPVLLRFSEYKK